MVKRRRLPDNVTVYQSPGRHAVQGYNMEISIGNINNPPPGLTLRVHRPHLLGNPFRIGKDGDRRTVIDKYKTWLYYSYLYDARVKSTINWLREEDCQITLLCYCHPLPCHATIIKDFVDNLDTKLLLIKAGQC